MQALTYATKGDAIRAIRARQAAEEENKAAAEDSSEASESDSGDESESEHSAQSSTTSDDSIAEKLLNALSKTELGENTQLFTPGVISFMNATKKVTTAFVENINEYRRVGGDKDDIVERVMGLNLLNTGNFNSNLKMYITNGSYTVCSKKIGTKSKIPVITIFGVLSMMVVLYEHIHGENVVEDFSEHSTVNLVYAFQRFLVRFVKMAEKRLPFEDHGEMWKSQGLSHSTLIAGRKRGADGGNDLYYHHEWMEFFTGDTKMIRGVISDIKQCNELRKEMMVVERLSKRNEQRTERLIEKSGEIEVATQKMLTVDTQLRVLKNKKEQVGDKNTGMFVKAMELNAKSVDVDLDDNGDDDSVFSVTVKPHKLLRFIETTEEPKKRTRTRKSKNQ